jgi:hypothetical protein
VGTGGEAQPAHDTDCSPPSNAEVKNEKEIYTPPLLDTCMAVPGQLYFYFFKRTEEITISNLSFY